MDERILVVYVGYPADLQQQPAAWTEDLFRAEAEGASLRFFLSGGGLTENLQKELARREAPDRFSFLSGLLSKAYAGRLLPSLMTEKVQAIAETAGGPASSELRVLADLWVLSRADVYLVDCDSVGRGRCGMETLYAEMMGLTTIGVTDTPILDPWYHYHLGRVIKPHDALRNLLEVRDSLEVSGAKLDSVEPEKEKGEYEPHEEVGFGD